MRLDYKCGSEITRIKPDGDRGERDKTRGFFKRTAGIKGLDRNYDSVCCSKASEFSSLSKSHTVVAALTIP